MPEKLLEIRGLRVSTGGREILHGLDLGIGAGETHVLMGPNGAGKSTLAAALMGHPGYAVSGEVRFHGADLLAQSVSERAKSGLFLSFQNPVEVPGLSLENFLRAALEQRRGEKLRPWAFHRQVTKALATLQMEEGYAGRELNVGFSGGEKKKAEILQMLLLRPTLAILDETDSGLDVDAVRTVSRGIEEFQKDKAASLFIITHNAAILSALRVDRVHVLVDGRFATEGGPELIEQIGREGFVRYEGAAR